MAMCVLSYTLFELEWESFDFQPSVLTAVQERERAGAEPPMDELGTIEDGLIQRLSLIRRSIRSFSPTVAPGNICVHCYLRLQAFYSPRDSLDRALLTAPLHGAAIRPLIPQISAQMDVTPIDAS